MTLVEPVGRTAAGSVDAESQRPSTRGRVRGIDAARALAIVGMVMVHFAPFPVPVDDPLSLAYSTSYGKASILFVVLAGVGVSLLAGDRSRERLRSTWQRLVFRAAVLFPMGLVLELLGTRVAVILQYYALYFLIAGVGALLPDRWLLGAALALTAASPVVLLAARFAEPGWFDNAPGEVSLDQPVRLLRALALTGYYPAITWAPPVLFGVWLGRRHLGSRRTQWTLAGGGTAVAAAAYLASAGLTSWLGRPPDNGASWRRLILSEGHSEMPLAILGATAVATLVLGLCLLLGSRLPRLSWPLAAMGQLAITIYVGHLFVLAFAPQLLLGDTVEGAALSVLRFTVIAAAAASLWRIRFSRGPIESVLHLPWSRTDPPPARPIGVGSTSGVDSSPTASADRGA